ncbi:MAG: hypothetical protein Q7S86_01575 [bacterium]|nr:hypothetical protein [bacterium]
MKKIIIVIVIILLVIVGILYFGAPDTATQLQTETAIDQSADTTASIDADLNTVNIDGDLDADFKSLDADINSL